jgi:hypothetical protein
MRAPAIVLVVALAASPCTAAEPREAALALHGELVALSPQLAASAAATPADPAEAANLLTADVIMPLHAALDTWSTALTLDGEAAYEPYADCRAAGEALAAHANALAFALRGIGDAPLAADADAPFREALALCENALGLEPSKAP